MPPDAGDAAGPVVAEAAHRRRAIALAAASFAAWGAGLALPGALLPALLDPFAADAMEAGTMLALQPAAYLVAVLASARLVRAIGLHAVLGTAVAVFAVGTGAFGLASSWAAGAVALFVGGLGLGLLEVAGNALLVVVGGARRANVLNVTHLFFGVGSFLAPAVATRVVAAGGSWRTPFLVMAALTALVAVGWRSLPIATPRAPALAEGSAGNGGSPLLLAVLLGTYVGAETGIGAWLTHYVVSTHHVSLDYAGTCLAFYWSGLAAGRLLLGGLAHRVRQERLILALAVLATAGLAVALRAPSAPGAFLGFTVTGLGFSGIFPATIALGGQYRPQAATQVTRLLIIGAGVGGVAVPWTMSAIVAHAGVGAGMGFYTAVAAMMIALALALPRSAHSA